MLVRWRERPVRLLEIGVGGYGRARQGGASLRMWPTTFPSGSICRSASRCFRPTRRTRLGCAAFGSSTARPTSSSTNASHRAAETNFTFDILFPLLRPAGIYAVEDLHCALRPVFNGFREGAGIIIVRLQHLNRDMHDQEVQAIWGEHRHSAYRAMFTGLHVFYNVALVERGENTSPSLFAFDAEHPEVCDQLAVLLGPAGGEEGAALTRASLLDESRESCRTDLRRAGFAAPSPVVGAAQRRSAVGGRARQAGRAGGLAVGCARPIRRTSPPGACWPPAWPTRWTCARRWPRWPALEFAAVPAVGLALRAPSSLLRTRPRRSVSPRLYSPAAGCRTWNSEFQRPRHVRRRHPSPEPAVPGRRSGAEIRHPERGAGRRGWPRSMRGRESHGLRPARGPGRRSGVAPARRTAGADWAAMPTGALARFEAGA